MKKEILTIGVVIVFVSVGFSGCLNESTVPTLAKQMEDTYNSISAYRATVNYSTYNDYSREYIKTIKKPDKLRYEYLTPEYKEGDLDIINGNTQWTYDKSKNMAYQDSCNINIGEESLATPDFLNMLLCLMNNFSVQQLDDEVVGEFNTYVLEITPLTQTTFSKWKYWIDKVTLFPIKWEIYDGDGDVRDTTLITNFEINVGISDSEFELSEDVEILTPEDWINPQTIEECEEIVGFPILFPTYLPQDYSVDNYRWMMQGIETEKMVTIWFDHNTNEEKTITLHEALNDFLEELYSLRNSAAIVDINGLEGKYYIGEDTGQYGEVVYTRSCLSWNLNEYWLLLEAGGDAFLDADEMVKIAESINT